MSKTFGVPWPEFNDGLTYNDVVSASDSELTLIDYYSSRHTNSAPLQGWLQRINNGQITVDGTVVREPKTFLRFLMETTFFDYILGSLTNDKLEITVLFIDIIEIFRAGSKLVYHRLPWQEPDAPYLLEILYEDDDVIALNKPSGLQVLPGGLFQQRTVLTQLQWWGNKQNSLPACQESHSVPVHRLGRGTSGILLCAKTKLAKMRLAAYFADGTSVVGSNRDADMKSRTVRKISKIYRALVNGILDKDEIVIKQPIGIVQYPGVAKGLYVASPSGKPALSKVAVIERDMQGDHTIVQVEIQSGRPHQIRIHLSFIGHPLIGDPLYVSGGQPKRCDSEFTNESYALDGGYQRPVKPVPGDCGYHLHAHQLVLSHPTTNEVIKITAPLPPVLRTRGEEEEEAKAEAGEVDLGSGDCCGSISDTSAYT